ncbi:hypothetical protein Tsubulata_039112 [Turnera subulata]|uniref:Kinesin motor domain-containing protein n=1 Tax=Turnera subulata TaxID=218843 RepID=A0A9Q0F634_9ROSI|nr:hypothetical protein Tsubulata_039112 [Turnera subulata]
MSSVSDRIMNQCTKINCAKSSNNSGDVYEPTLTPGHEAKQIAVLIEWINSILPHVNIPTKASSEELRARLIDGTVLLQILHRLRPISPNEAGVSDNSKVTGPENVNKFLAGMDEMGIPRFEWSDLEKGSMRPVVDCLLTLKAQIVPAGDNLPLKKINTRCASPHGDRPVHSLESPTFVQSKLILSPDSRFQQALRSSGRYGAVSAQVLLHCAEPSAALMHNVGNKLHENAPTQSLLSVVNSILDESIERKSDEIPHRVASLLRRVVQEIERRISTQADHLRTQNNLFKAREEKYQSRISVLEALASGAGEERAIATPRDQFQQAKIRTPRIEEAEKLEDEEVARLSKEKDERDLTISGLKQELEIARKKMELHCLQMETDAKSAKAALEERDRELSALRKELEAAMKSYEQLCEQMEEAKGSQSGLEDKNLEVSQLRKELDLAKRTYEVQCMQMETESKSAKAALEERDREVSALQKELEAAKSSFEQLSLQMEREANGAKSDLEERLKELEQKLADSRNQVKTLERRLEDSKEKVKELEAHSERNSQMWSRKMHLFKDFVGIQFGALKGLRSSSTSIKDDILEVKKNYLEEFNLMGIHLRTLIDATQNYRVVLAENRKMYNELQDLKGNIRVFCRIRPFLRGQTGRKTTIDYIGEDGEMAVMNPAKPGKDGRRVFRFNKVYGPDSTQAEVFADTQQLIRCILDGYNVCIFAYGQTGSGKTHTMMGPNGASEEEWGVNYRALSDLFKISQDRKATFIYESIVLDSFVYLDFNTLGIMSTSQPSGLAVPDATMQPVTSTADVIDLMNTGLNNRAVSATAMNERSSRSHRFYCLFSYPIYLNILDISKYTVSNRIIYSVVSINVRGKDVKTGATMVGNLHLVDLAGSERVDRSEVTGDRLKEAQHINKSLSALGDVIFALAQKSSHVPYRNSKLTQLLQSSLGGHAKTLMFVQLNPDANAYSETMSTLKFAERVSGIELGAAKSNKEGRDVKELMEQVASLKDTIAKKDDEIERLQVLKDLKNTSPSFTGSSRTRT